MTVYFPASAGFLLLFLSDSLRLRALQAAPLSAGAGYLLVAGSMLQFLVLGLRDRGFRGIITIFGVLLSLVFGALLLFSVFFEIPRAKRRLGLNSGEALTRGTYGLSRHPGFLWFLGLMAGLVLFRGGGGLFFAAYISILNFLLILVQDQFYFPRFFTNYRDYQSQVPFLPGIRRRPSDEHA